MIKFLKSIFRFKPPPPVPDPVIGEVYRLNDVNPFNVVEAEILDVKSGWVQYRYVGTSMDFKFSKSIKDFLVVYKKVG